MPTVTLYHNSRCSKSRVALALLTEHGHTPVVIDYLAQPLAVPALQRLAEQLGLDSVRQMMRTDEAEFKALGLSDDVAEADLYAALAAQPKLLQRPIAVLGERAVIGRPPEAVLSLLPPSAGA